MPPPTGPQLLKVPAILNTTCILRAGFLAQDPLKLKPQQGGSLWGEWTSYPWAPAPQYILLKTPAFLKSTNNFLGSYCARAALLNRADQTPGLRELNTAVRKDKQENGCFQMSVIGERGATDVKEQVR